MSFPLHQIICRFHKHILVLTFFATLCAIILATQLRLDSNLFSLLPSDNTSVGTFFEITEEIGFQSVLVAVVEIPPDYEQKQAESFIELLADRFSQSPLIHEVEYKSGMMGLSSLFHEFMEYFPLLLKDQGLIQLATKLSDVEIKKQIRENKKLLMTPFSIAAGELVYNDPLGLRDLLEHAMSAPSGKHPSREYKGYYHTKDAGAYFLFIKPEEPPQNVVFSKELMAEVLNIQRTSLAEFADRPGNLSEKIEISYAGGYPIAVNDEATSKRDIKATVLGSFVAVMLLFGLSFRTTRIIFFVGAPLAISFIWTLGFAGLIFHELNILTCVFSCVLIGLGIDFAIHIVNRYFDEDKTDLDLPRRLDQTFQEAGAGLIVGGVTTAAAFYSIAFSDFKGFRELGIMTGTGVLFCLLAMLFVLPSLLVYFSRTNASEKSVKIAGFGLRTLLGLFQKYPKLIAIIVFATFFLLAISGIKIKFDDNLRNFRPPNQKTFHLQDKVTDWLGGSNAEILLVAEGKSEAEAMETNTAIYEALEELRISGVVAGVKSISKYFPAPTQQRENMELIRQHPDVFDIKRIKRTFNDALKEHGFEKLDIYKGYFERLSRAISAEKILLPSVFQGTELEKFLRMFIFQKGQRFKTVTYIVPHKDLWSRVDTTKLRKMISRKMEEKAITEEQFDLTGACLLTGDLKELIINNLKSSMWIASLCIIAVLTVYYRKLKLIALSTMPAVIGLGALVGIMAIFRLDFNFFNLIVLPMVIGIGIDDGIHLTNTFRRCSEPDMLIDMSRTARAVVLTSLTTLVGFGSIALSRYPGLRSMGYVAIIGISSCLLASIVVMPPVLTMIKRSERANAFTDEAT